MILSPDKYRKKKMQSVEPFIKDLQIVSLDIAVVIPSLNEFPRILDTFLSLEKSASFVKKHNFESKIKIGIINVVNNRASHSDAIKQNNAQLLLHLKNKNQIDFENAQIFYLPIDATKEGVQISEKDGVGLARKIGLDFAYLCTCANSNKTKLIACMDSDTLVEENYFSALIDSFFIGTKKAPVAGVTDFTHRKDGSQIENDTIVIYENYLKRHSQKLKQAKSPWFPVALGPTIVCTAEIYASCGGMNKKTAGEDFYFLQSILKVCPKEKFCFIDTKVLPSARISDRVPFGTGAAIKGFVDGTKKIVDFPDEFFEILKKWILLAEEICAKAVKEKRSCCEELIDGAKKISSDLDFFLRGEKTKEVWNSLFAQNCKSEKNFIRAFHCWFDGLKTIRLFHTLEDRANN